MNELVTRIYGAWSSYHAEQIEWFWGGQTIQFNRGCGKSPIYQWVMFTSNRTMGEDISGSAAARMLKHWRRKSSGS